MNVYLVWFTPKDQDSLLIGVYRGEQEAQQAIERMKPKRGFAQQVDGFEISAYELGKDHWTEGFILD